MEEITVHELKRMKDQGEEFLLLDVREPFEYEISNIDGMLIPLDQLADRINELAGHEDKEVVIMCRSGGRSARACEILSRNGFRQVKNLKGGVNDWARQIDPTLPVY